jgi:hypothetical protein
MAAYRVKSPGIKEMYGSVSCCHAIGAQQRRPIALSLALLALALTVCGGGGPVQSGQGPGPAVTTASPTLPDPGPPADQGAPLQAAA